MNSLNLRISAVKTGDNLKKNSETRASKVPLPPPYALSTDENVEKFRAAENVPQQINAVKQIFHSAGENVEILRFLADIILYSPLNHPVRNQLIALFSRDETRRDKDSLYESVDIAIAGLLHLIPQKDDDQVWNDLIVSLAACFNFSVALAALQNHMEDVLCLLHWAIGRWMEKLATVKSPSKKSVIFTYLHNTLRSVLSAMLEVSFDGISFTTALIRLNKTVEQIATLDELPMETCLNGARIAGHIARYFGIYDSFLVNARELNKVNELPICISALTTFILPYFEGNAYTFSLICKNLIRMANNYATKQNVLIYATRALYQYAHSLQQVRAAGCDRQLEHTKSSFIDMLEYAYAYLQHHIDTVRHLCRDLIKEIMIDVLYFDMQTAEKEIYDAINGTRLPLPVRCIVLKQCVMVFGAQEVITNSGDLFSQIFNEHLGRDTDVDNAYETLLVDSYLKMEFTSWSSIWLDFLLQIAALQDERSAATDRIIMTAVVLGPKVLSHVMVAPNLTMSTKLSALCAVRKAGKQSDHLKLLLVDHSNELPTALLHGNEAISLMALRVIVECHKTTEPLTMEDYNNIELYTKYNINCPDPDVRQKSFALLTKALVRCELSLAKEHKQCAETGAPPVESLHLKFLRNYMRLVVSNLFPGANYSRRWLSLQLLEQCLTICYKLNFDCAHFVPKNCIQRLVDVLSDSYEGNKVFAVRVLKLVATQMSGDSSATQELNFELEDIKKMLISLRPPDSVTATYKLDLFCELNSRRPDVFGIDTGHRVQYYPTIYAALNWCLRELENGLAMAVDDLRRAAKFNPLYGLLYAMRHLMKILDLKIISEEVGWRAFIADLVKCCEELINVVAPVVNSASPEGHVPIRFSQLTAELQKMQIARNARASTSRPIITDARTLAGPLTPELLEQINTTPQMVLLCSWRTVKEISLIYGELVLNAPLQDEEDPIIEDDCITIVPHLITLRHLRSIGLSLQSLLSETKHRGAFEQAYVGFGMYCTRLWRCNIEVLHNLPLSWIDSQLELIEKSSNEITAQLRTTRRSAGLPFMIQALVASELHIGSSHTLHYCINRLFNVFQKGEEEYAESRTHALNILRALFRCSELSELVGEHVADGVKCALHCYEASTWMERNSASLLFAALMTRMFGVMRTKDADNLNIRNRMTGRIFFTRYPELYDYFYNELRTATEKVLAGEPALKLYPMLLLLSRLYPSGLEGAETNLNLKDFVPFIAACSGVSELNTRNLTAKALCALVDKDALEELLREKCAKLLYAITNPEKRHLNTLHGDLVQIEHLLKHCQRLKNSLIVDDVVSTLRVFTQICTPNNGMLFGTVLDIMNLIMESQTVVFDNGLQFRIFANNHYHEIVTECARYCKTIWRSYQIYMLHVMRLKNAPLDMIMLLLKPPLDMRVKNSELLETTLNIILLILLGRSKEAISVKLNDADMEEFEFDASELQFVRTLPNKFRLTLIDELCKNEMLLEQLMILFRKKDAYPGTTMKCYAILSMLKVNVYTLSDLLSRSARFPSDGKSSITLVMTRRIKDHGIPDTDWDAVLAHALELVDPALPDCVRMKSAYLHAQLMPHCETVFRQRDLQLIGAYVRLVVQLLGDDDEDIRKYTSKVTSIHMWKSEMMRDLSVKEFDTSGGGDVTPSVAQVFFLKSIADLLKNMAIDDNDFLLEVFNVIVEPHLIDSGIEGKEVSRKGKASSFLPQRDIASPKDKLLVLDPEIFDRNEANMYIEPMTVVYNAQLAYRRTFSDKRWLLDQLKNYVDNY